MANRVKTNLGGAGFYTVLTLCVVAVGVGGYFALFGGDKAQEEPPPPIETAAPEPELQETPPVVETILPEEVEEPAPVMPAEEVDDTPVVAVAPRLVVSPLKGEVLAAFSVDQLSYDPTLEDWRTHDGVDIAATLGTTVMAACAGTVSAVTDDALMGTTVTISHSDGYETTYANLQGKPVVEAGDSVSAGAIIGAVGATAAAESAQGPHLHFSVTQDGDAIDPDQFLNQ